MHLSIFPITKFTEYYLKNLKRSEDSGLDLPCFNSITVPGNAKGFMIPLGVKCAPSFADGINRGYFLFPRSSTGKKTPLRLSNSLGIIDFGYRGEIMACVDNVSDTDFIVPEGTRLFQLCAPDLSPIQFNLVDIEHNLSSSERGSQGFGSTGY